MSDKPDSGPAIDDLALGDVEAIRCLNAIPLEQRTEADRREMARQLKGALAAVQRQRAVVIDIASNWGFFDPPEVPPKRGRGRPSSARIEDKRAKLLLRRTLGSNRSAARYIAEQIIGDKNTERQRVGLIGLINEAEADTERLKAWFSTPEGIAWIESKGSRAPLPFPLAGFEPAAAPTLAHAYRLLEVEVAIRDWDVRGRSKKKR